MRFDVLEHTSNSCDNTTLGIHSNILTTLGFPLYGREIFLASSVVCPTKMVFIEQNLCSSDGIVYECIECSHQNSLLLCEPLLSFC